MFKNTQIFRQFVTQVSNNKTIPSAITSSYQKYNFKHYLLHEFTPEFALSLHETIFQKFYKNGHHHASSNWFENQLRLYVWVLVCYAHIHSIELETMEEKDWKFFSTLFPFKDPSVFEYQCKSLYLDNKGKNWEQDQDDLLIKVIQQQQAEVGEERKIKWNQVSKSLFNKSEKIFLRSPKQCRERWNNYLDPSKIKGMWKREECLSMFEYVLQNGKKWANIVKLLKFTRNEHSIKNKFNSLLKKQMKSNKNVPQKDIYKIIISRIKSAMNNQKSQNSDSALCYDFDEEEKKQLTENISKKKDTSQFASNFMKKLMNFGSEPNIKQQAPTKKTKTNLKQKNNNITQKSIQSSPLIKTPIKNEQVSKQKIEQMESQYKQHQQINFQFPSFHDKQSNNSGPQINNQNQQNENDKSQTDRTLQQQNKCFY